MSDILRFSGEEVRIRTSVRRPTGFHLLCMRMIEETKSYFVQCHGGRFTILDPYEQVFFEYATLELLIKDTSSVIAARNEPASVSIETKEESSDLKIIEAVNVDGKLVVGIEFDLDYLNRILPGMFQVHS